MKITTFLLISTFAIFACTNTTAKRSNVHVLLKSIDTTKSNVCALGEDIYHESGSSDDSDSMSFNPFMVSHNIQRKALIRDLDSLTCQECFDDSVKAIILGAHKIMCTLEVLNPIDTLRQESTKVLPRKLNSIVGFLLLAPDNFESNDIVYGMFHSDVCYTLKASKKKFVHMHIDFGLRKWKLTDSKEQEICTFDMGTSSMHFLRLTRLIFPEDLTLNLLYNNLKTK